MTWLHPPWSTSNRQVWRTPPLTASKQFFKIQFPWCFGISLMILECLWSVAPLSWFDLFKIIYLTDHNCFFPLNKACCHLLMTPAENTSSGVKFPVVLHNKFQLWVIRSSLHLTWAQVTGTQQHAESFDLKTATTKLIFVYLHKKNLTLELKNIIIIWHDLFQPPVGKTKCWLEQIVLHSAEGSWMQMH